MSARWRVAVAVMAAAAAGTACGTVPVQHPPPPVPAPQARQAAPPSYQEPATGWPDGHSTGVPAHTALRVHVGSLVTSRDGQVIDGVEVRGGIVVKNDRVTIRRTRVVTGGGQHQTGIRVLDGHRGITVEDCEIDMRDVPDSTGIGFAGLTVRRCNIHDAERGIQIGDHVMATDNWVHDLYTGPGSHSEDVAIFGSLTPVQSVIWHNTLSNPRSQTAVVFIKTDQGPVRDVVVSDNYLDGGNYTVYSVAGGYDQVTPPQGVVVTDNVFSRACVYGAGSLQGRVTFAGNTYTDRSPVALGRPRPRPLLPSHR